MTREKAIAITTANMTIDRDSSSLDPSESPSGAFNARIEAQTRFPELDPLVIPRSEFLNEVQTQIQQRLESFNLELDKGRSSPFGDDDLYSVANRMILLVMSMDRLYDPDSDKDEAKTQIQDRVTDLFVAHVRANGLDAADKLLEIRGLRSLAEFRLASPFALAEGELAVLAEKDPDHAQDFLDGTLLEDFETISRDKTYVENVQDICKYVEELGLVNPHQPIEQFAEAIEISRIVESLALGKDDRSKDYGYYIYKGAEMVAQGRVGAEVGVSEGHEDEDVAESEDGFLKGLSEKIGVTLSKLVPKRLKDRKVWLTGGLIGGGLTALALWSPWSGGGGNGEQAATGVDTPTPVTRDATQVSPDRIITGFDPATEQRIRTIEQNVDAIRKQVDEIVRQGQQTPGTPGRQVTIPNFSRELTDDQARAVLDSADGARDSKLRVRINVPRPQQSFGTLDWTLDDQLNKVGVDNFSPANPADKGAARWQITAAAISDQGKTPADFALVREGQQIDLTIGPKLVQAYKDANVALSDSVKEDLRRAAGNISAPGTDEGVPLASVEQPAPAESERIVNFKVQSMAKAKGNRVIVSGIDSYGQRVQFSATPTAIGELDIKIGDPLAVKGTGNGTGEWRNGRGGGAQLVSYTYIRSANGNEVLLNAESTPTRTIEPTPTRTIATHTPEPTSTLEPTPTRTIATHTPQPTSTLEPTPTRTIATHTPEPTSTLEPTPTRTIATHTPQPTSTLEPTPTRTIATHTPEPTATPTATRTPSPTPTVSVSPTPSPTPTPTATPSPTPTITVTPSPTPTAPIPTPTLPPPAVTGFYGNDRLERFAPVAGLRSPDVTNKIVDLKILRGDQLVSGGEVTTAPFGRGNVYLGNRDYAGVDTWNVDLSGKFSQLNGGGIDAQDKVVTIHSRVDKGPYGKIGEIEAAKKLGDLRVGDAVVVTYGDGRVEKKEIDYIGQENPNLLIDRNSDDELVGYTCIYGLYDIGDSQRLAFRASSPVEEGMVQESPIVNSQTARVVAPHEEDVIPYPAIVGEEDDDDSDYWFYGGFLGILFAILLGFGGSFGHRIFQDRQEKKKFQVN